MTTKQEIIETLKKQVAAFTEKTVESHVGRRAHVWAFKSAGRRDA
jgi:hypothetical protein